jgi:hypothetical protein
MSTTSLDPTDYWKLRTVNAELERDQAAQAAIQSRLEGSRAKRQQLWGELTEKYKLDPNGQYSARDEDCSLTVNPNGAPPQ